MDELIDILQTQTGLEFYNAERPQDVTNCVVYNSVRSGIISDGKKELSKYKMYFLLVCNVNIDENIKALEDALYQNIFRDITINQTIKTNDGNYQTSITGTKILK